MDEHDDRRVDALFAELEDEVAKERGVRAFLRSRTTPARVGLSLALSAATVVGAILATGRTHPFDARALGWVIGTTALLGAVVLMTRAALQPLYRPQWVGPSRFALTLGVVALVLGAIVVSSDGSMGALAGGRCLLVGALAALPTFGLVSVLDRVPGRGALLGALAGALTGALTIQLLCPGRQSLSHALTEHFGAVLIVTVGLTLAGTLRTRLAA